MMMQIHCFTNFLLMYRDVAFLRVTVDKRENRRREREDSADRCDVRLTRRVFISDELVMKAEMKFMFYSAQKL